ncbi:MAG TPA: MFS transporter [Guyparkeria sp.]|nr:MFS transporter [Guyparkeria sp.]
MTISSTTHQTRQVILALVALMLVALNLRPALTSVGPVLRTLGENLSLYSTGQGVLTTLPVLFLGIAAPLAPWAARRLGVEQAVFLAIVLLGVALAARPYIGVTGLFIGTAIAGGCIGIVNVLLPGIVKRDFPNHVSLLTGVYSAVLCIGAALASATVEPLRQVFDNNWQPALAVWMIPAAIAAAAWWTQLQKTPTSTEPVVTLRKSLFRDALAWQVAIYMGLQSSLAYTVFGWLPTILQDRGIDVVTSGIATSLSIMVQVITAIMAPWVASYMRDQRFMIVFVVLLTMAGLAGCFYDDTSRMWFWAVILGLGQGGSFSMALTLLAVRARTPKIAARLSGMAQGLGYTLAAIGPLFVGVLHGMTNSWEIAGLFLLLIGAGAIIAGIGAGRNLCVLED